ncbi:MAG: glycoside hydrolase family protein [Opitutales bacterium]|nr:glycoside hydrolase family protein [Opitutales bacterium]
MVLSIRTLHSVVAGLLLTVSASLSADVILLGSNLPAESVLDGDFEQLKAGWRAPQQSPYWTTELVRGQGKVGFALGQLMNNGATLATAESKVLDHTELKALNAADVLAWRFASNTEYPCDGRVSLSLVFGVQEHVLASRVKVPNGPEEPKVYEGFYTVTAQDAQAGMPKVKFTLESTHGIKVYVDWVNLKVLRDQTGAPSELAANAVEEGIELTWHGTAGDAYTIIRSSEASEGYQTVASDVKENRWIDTSVTNGKNYFYAVKRSGEKMVASAVVSARKVDSVAPVAPHALKAFGEDWVVKLYWETSDQDIAYYKVFRGDADGENMACIAPHVAPNRFEDMLPIKSAVNTYAIQAVDYSGNVGALSEIATAQVKAVNGASFSDLLLPMPIHKELRSDVWGAEGVLPRDPDNGVESYDWSYWGGKVIKDKSDGLYHLLVVRWPEGDRKGHWAWPYSTVAHTVSEQPTGPFHVKKEIAYEFKKGLGHNANIIPLNDGRYALYSLIDWKAMVLTSETMNGPWEVLGEMKVNVPKDYKNAYRLERNLSGVQCEDGSFLFVTKAGAMMRSEQGILGPYDVLTGVIGENETIPEQYRKSNYEDPTMWYDGVQYHMLINAFLDYRAIYLRSPDGIHWKYEDGLAYTPTCTEYEDDTRTFWYKVERPNVLQDAFGRATHLSLAAVDVKKDDDYGNDAHSSKHLIIPLVVSKRLTILNAEPVTGATKRIELLIHSEGDFNAQQEIDLDSLRFGASEAVNFGRGSEAVSTTEHEDGLIIEFDGLGSGITERNFVGKLIGRSKSGDLIVGYSKLGEE